MWGGWVERKGPTFKFLGATRVDIGGGASGANSATSSMAGSPPPVGWNRFGLEQPN